MTNIDPRIAYFDRLAQNWDNENPSQQMMVDKLTQHADLLAIQPGCRMLEVGCGTGKTSGYLAGAVAPGRLTAIDFSSEMIAHASAKAIDADFACVDVCSDDLGEKIYDIVLCFHCFPHFRDQLAALKNFERAMKDDARLIVMHIASSGHINGLHASMQGAVNVDVLPVGDQWPPLLSEAGLTQCKLIDTEGLFFLKARKS